MSPLSDTENRDSLVTWKSSPTYFQYKKTSDLQKSVPHQLLGMKTSAPAIKSNTFLQMKIKTVTSVWLLQTPTKLPDRRIDKCMENNPKQPTNQHHFLGKAFQSRTQLWCHLNCHLLPSGSGLVTTPRARSSIVTLLEVLTISRQTKKTH